MIAAGNKERIYVMAEVEDFDVSLKVIPRGLERRIGLCVKDKCRVITFLFRTNEELTKWFFALMDTNSQGWTFCQYRLELSFLPH